MSERQLCPSRLRADEEEDTKKAHGRSRHTLQRWQLSRCELGCELPKHRVDTDCNGFHREERQAQRREALPVCVNDNELRKECREDQNGFRIADGDKRFGLERAAKGGLAPG